MAHRLLVTLRRDDEAKTCSFDDSVQSVLWLGFDEGADARNALALLEASDDDLYLRSLGDWRIVSPTANDQLPSVRLDNQESVFELVSADRREYVSLYVRPSAPGIGQFRKLYFTGDSEFIIGRTQAAGFYYESQFVSAQHVRFTHRGGSFMIQDLQSGNGTLVNSVSLEPMTQVWLQVGDVVQVLDLTICIGRGMLSVNCPPGLSVRAIPGMEELEHERVRELAPEVHSTDQEPPAFYPAPRLSKSIRPIELEIDDPPQKKQEEGQPFLMQLGPSFLMGISSVFMVSSSIANLADGGSVISALPSIAMAVAMIGGSVIWPIVSRAYNRRQDADDEAKRSRRYVTYLDEIETRLANEAASQSQILQENRRPVGELFERASESSPLLMNRTSVHPDFMELRVGVGDLDVVARVAWPERHFSLADDRMLDKVTALSKNPPMLRGVPLAFNPARHHVSGILGGREVTWDFVRGMLVQVCALYSYQEVKVVLVADEDERGEWDFLTSLGHLYDDSGSRRLVALTYSGMVELDLMMERELEARTEAKAEVLGDYGTYYVIVCSNIALAERSEAVARLLRLRANKGFSLVYLGRDLRDLPRECGFIIDLTTEGGIDLGISLDSATKETRQKPRQARMFERSDVSGTLRQFDPDILVTREQARSFALDLARVRLDLPEQRSDMPTSLGFLELFEVGNVAHLNIGQRWAESDASQSLQTPIGIDEQGELALLNLHENIHGPHGLIAGTTGSGKSEFIITYILSMCVNYDPDSVAFVLIDYKGGGLAGAFDNEHYHLPHLAGTITNLDGGAIQRSLASIKSELKRRQDMLNHARDVTGEATVDIYKYLSYYRQGVLSEPLPHLFIVADEFAELKAQEPDFMEELISAARIGRSLGVHLILATQKPTGVVNDQIWSNARFKVSLKVSDAADSNEMIRRDVAAEITRPGQFYLLVGYNESFSGGQAAYAGLPYAPSEQFEPRHDNVVELLDDEGVPVARLLPTSAATRRSSSELNAVLGQVEESARLVGKRAKRLWLDPLKTVISLGQLVERYGELEDDLRLPMVLGEVDDPEHQRQFRHVIDLADVGGVVLYGAQGSGVDGLVAAMLLSACYKLGPDRLWVYAIDYGSGALTRLESTPQTGGVVLPGDEERLENLLEMVEAEVTRRRTLMREHGGQIEQYNDRADEPLPYIVVAITNLSALSDADQEFQDRLAALVGESTRYGIFFILTVEASGVLRMRLRTAFALHVPTLLNDANEYVAILGSAARNAPQRVERRGLIALGKRVLEFQGVSIGTDEDSTKREIDAIRSLWGSCPSTARPIPALPQRVYPADVTDSLPHSANLPIGLSKRGIEPVWCDLEKTPFVQVLGDDIESLQRYLKGVHEVYEREHGSTYLFIDPQRVLGDVNDNNVIRDADAVERAVLSMCDGSLPPRVVVFTNMVQTMASLSIDASTRLGEYIASGRGSSVTALVIVSEYWRIKQVYDEWYRAISSSDCGVWVAGGFSDQVAFRFVMRQEFRVPAERSDGFYAARGNVVSVRLLEATRDGSVRGD